MLHFESLRHIHQELPNASTEEIVQVVKSRMPKFTDAHMGFHGIPNRSAVKFTCIVQDNGYSMEIYPHSFPVNHTETGEEDNFNFLFMQSPDDSWELNDKAMANAQTVQKFVEKQPHCCIIIPPSNADILLDRLSLNSAGGAVLPDHYSHPLISKLFEKKLPGVPRELVCNVKTFSYQPGFSLNQVFHVYGVLEIPSMTNYDISESTTLEEILPTIHCIHYEPLSPFKLARSIEESQDTVLAMASVLREQALLSLTSCLLGDKVAAEYLYLSLFSKISKRIAGVPTGSFGLNFINESFSSATCALVLDAVKQMKPITAMLPLNIDSLNKRVFIQPSQARFDGEYHGLCRGEFQAPDGSFFLFNECEMTEGTLVERGVRNIQAIQSAIDFGMVNYELEFGSMERECDFNFVAIGKVASLLSMPFRVKVVASQEPLNTAVLSEKSGLLIHHLIDITQNIPFKVSESMEEIIHSSFVKSQKFARENGEPTDDGSLLLKRLQVAENLAKSLGLVELDEHCWARSGELEKLRLERQKR